MARDQAGARTRPARVLIVDDHPIVREGLALLISSQPDLEVCGAAEDVATAGQLVDELKPDLVIVDLSLKGSSGLELIKRIKAKHPSVRILVSSIHDESVYAERALRAGAKCARLAGAHAWAAGEVSFIEHRRRRHSGHRFQRQSLRVAGGPRTCNAVREQLQRLRWTPGRLLLNTDALFG